MFLDDFVERVDDKLGHQVVGKTLAEVQGLMVDRDLDEFDPANANAMFGRSSHKKLFRHEKSPNKESLKH